MPRLMHRKHVRETSRLRMSTSFCQELNGPLVIAIPENTAVIPCVGAKVVEGVRPEPSGQGLERMRVTCPRKEFSDVPFHVRHRGFIQTNQHHRVSAATWLEMLRIARPENNPESGCVAHFHILSPFARA